MASFQPSKRTRYVRFASRELLTTITAPGLNVSLAMSASSLGSSPDLSIAVLGIALCGYY